MFTTIIALALVTQTPASGIGDPPKDASPELAAMYRQMNAEVGVYAPPPASPVASPVRQQVLHNAVVHHREIPPPAPRPFVAEARRAVQSSSDSTGRAQRRANWNRQYEAEQARAQTIANARAAAYAYYNTPDYVNVTRNSNGSFSTYMTTPGGATEFKDYTPVIRTPRYGIGVGPSYFDYDVYTSQSQSYGH